MPYPFIAEIDVSKVHFSPLLMEGSRQKVEMYKDNSSTKTSNKLVFNLCADPREPFACRYKLDTVREDQDGSRRGLIVKLEDPIALAALQALDDHVMAYALKNCKDFFKNQNMTETDVRQRYRPLVFKAQDQDEFFCTKFKVKCKDWPTELHLLHDDKTLEHRGGSLEHISQYGASVAPILTAYGLWFMGGGLSFGVTIQAEKMVVKPGAPRPLFSEFCNKDTPFEFTTRKRMRDDDDEMLNTRAVELDDDDTPM